MVSRNRKIARRIGQAVANDVLDITGAISAGAGVTVYATADDLPTTGLTAGDEAFVSGSNRLYISNGTGWYSIGLVNTNPAITSVEDPSSNTTPFTLATDGSALVLTITAADPEDVPLTYSYAVTTGSLTNGGGITATVVQGTGANTNQFTITPTTTEAYAGTFDLTFTTSDGINQASSVNSFTLSFITTIANSNYTTLLATATGTSDNNNITDASSNNHSITVTGDAHAGTFSPYRSGGYSTNFPGGTSVYLQVENLQHSFGTNDFTIECFAYITANFSVLFDFNDNPERFRLATNTNNGGTSDDAALRLRLNWYKEGTGRVTTYSTDNAINKNQWNHIAVCRSGSSMKMFANGNEVYSESVGGNYDFGSANTTDMQIGRWDTTGDVLNGKISNFRIINNSALYNGSYTVPTENFTAQSGTVLLTCHLPYIADDSTNNHTITVNGNTSTKPFSPYDYNEYSATDHGGSVYFDGTGDALRIADNSNIQLGTSPFTIEGWFYCTDTTPTQGILAKRDASSEYWRWIIAGGNLNFRFQSAGGGSFTFNTVSVPANTWCHFAVTRDSNSDVRQFVNGISTQNAINSTGNFDISGSTLRVGEYELNTGHFNGFVSDIKIVKNSALYTSDFTPPTAPLSSSGTSLHIKGTDASIIDKSQGSNLKLVGNTTGSTTQVKFAGTKSMYFDGSSDRIEIDGPINLGTQPFTYEAWVYTTDSSWIFMCIGSYDGSSTHANSGSFIEYVNNDFYLYNFTGSGNTSAEAFVHNQGWKHVAFCRQSNGNHDLYLDGTRIINYTGWNSQDYGSLDKILIGDYFTQFMSDFNGYFQDIRLTIGESRYTANFTPPTASLEG